MSGLVGAPVARREDARILRGRGTYLDDLELPGQAHAAFVRSVYARARILAVRVPEAAEGLVAVVTAADLDGRVRLYPVQAPEGMAVADAGHPVLAGAEVRYAGQPIALVVAESRALAEDAAELVDVEYEPLDAVVEPRAAGERLLEWSNSGGDVAGAFADAAHVVRGRYALPRLVAAPIETRGAIVAEDAGELTVWCSAQDPHRPRAGLAHVLHRADDTIRVVVPDVGGAFGSKGVVPPEVAAMAVAAIDLGRPVKWAEDRLENFLAAYQGRGMEAEVELALAGDGRMLAVRARVWADLGAYLYTSSAIPPWTAGMLMCGPYEIGAAEVQVVGARTDKVPTGPYRGAGRPEAAYFLERVVDDAARELGMDPAELRRRNLVRAWPHETPLGHTYDSGDYERCLDVALELAAAAPAGRGLTGTGIAMYVERAGGMWESAEATIEPGGRVVVASSASPHGQGHDTTFAQIAADRLGVAMDDVDLRFGDSAAVPRGVGTFGSRSTAMAGSAVALALDRIVAAARSLAAERLGADEAALVWEGGRFTAPGGEAVSLRVLAAAASGLHAEARFESPLVFSSGAYVASVEIDPETGVLGVLHVAAVDDGGTVVNPLLAHGQVLGGIAQGLGECLSEEARHDDEGQLTTASFADYSLLTAAEMPPLAIGIVETPTPHNPLGAKGLGEGGAIGSLPAVANAVAAALGGRHVDPPYTEARLWAALHEEVAG